MRTYLKAQAAAVIGSMADFLVSVLLVNLLHWWYLYGNLSGNICGAIVQFLLGRNWAFQAGDKQISGQVLKYILTLAGNLLLQALGTYLLVNRLKLDFVLSKIIVSVTLGLSYNYFVQKWFVFS